MIYKKALICKTKNLFSTSTEVGTLSGWSNTTPRQFEECKWYIGITVNNYYSPNEIVEYEFTENYAYVKTKGSGYGIGRAFKCEPNQTYTVSCKWIKNTNIMKIATGFFGENGNYLSFISAGDLAERHTFTTPANCKWFTVCFPGTVGSSYIYNIQLEKGSTATNYVPYGYLQSYKTAIKVSDICQLLDKSKFPATRTDQGVTYTNNGDGTVTVNGTSTSPYYSNYQIPMDVKRYIPGHKYALLSTGIQTDVGTINYTSQVIIADFLPGKYYYRGPNSIAEFPEYEGTVRSFRWEIRVNKGITANNIVIKPQLFDLTEMYGAGNEPATVEEFKQKFPNDLYPYRPYCFVDSYKSTVICKTKNLFDISKVTNSSSIQSDDKDIICSTYGSSIGVLKDLCPSLKVGDTVTLSLTVKSTTSIPPTFVQIQGQILNFKVGNGSVTFTATEEGLNSNFYLYNTTYENRDVPTTSVFTDIMIELGDTATSYVPYGHL